MEQYRPLLLEIWREACRHIDIRRSTETIVAMLRKQIPVRQLLVRRIDWERSCLETVAVGLTDGGLAAGEAKSTFDPAEADQLRAWFASMEVTRRDEAGSGSSIPGAIIPQTLPGRVLAGPLGSAEHPLGVLLVAVSPETTLDDCHTALTKLLLEPFSVALENDQRVQEMTALREAAEAERRSLLNKLGRKALADTVVGADSGLRSVMERVELVARSDVPVLIVGETGTGKELVARLIHNRSPRHAGPFIRVNCGAIPSELIDSQLFGHEKGAFTGAIEMRQGWFERASGGTLLLDELGELPLAAQVRLLRILQDGWLERVGGHSAIHVDVRIVAATHRDLASMVAEGAFREDLWYRLAVFPIRLPPLRERPEDISSLATHLAERAATRFGLPLVHPSPEDITLLASYNWPGNIRELGAVIDRAAILGNGARLEVAKALGVETVRGTIPVAQERSDGALPVSGATTSGNVPASAVLPLDTVIRRHIETALTATHGRIEGPFGAAKLLKINPHTLRARMRKLGIDWQRFREASDG